MNISTRSEMNVNACFAANAFKNVIGKTLFSFLILLFGINSFAQTYTDNATNAAYSSGWTNGTNGGTGFAAWGLSSDGVNAGHFKGDPSGNGMGTTGIGTSAFGMYGHSSQYAYALRNFSSSMGVGDVLTFYWAMNWDCGSSGSKGWELKSGSTTIFSVNNSNSASITYGGVSSGTVSTNYGTTPMLITVTRTSSTQYSVSITRRLTSDGTFSTTITSSSAIDNIRFYIGSQQDNSGNRNMYLNAFSLAKPSKYRSATSGNWGTAGTWEISTDGGSSWSAAGAAPGSASYSTVTIRNGHTVSQNNNYSSTNNTIVVDAGGTLNMVPNPTGPTVDMGFSTMTVNGTLVRNNSVATYNGTITIGNGGKYTHAINGGSVPTCTWSSGSTFEVTGISSATSFSAGSPQSFHHVVWNCTSQTSIFSMNALTTVNGNLTVQSTGASPSASSGLYFTNSTAITSTISGNLTVSGGFFAPFGSATANSSTLNISGNLSISGGTFDIYRPATNTGTINLAGDFSMSGGTLTKFGAGTGNFNFSKSGTQTYSKSSGTISGAINFTVNNGSTLDFGTSVLDGSTGTFTLSSGAGLITANTAGITTTGATGSIQVSGTRTYNTGANYTFNGSSAQATGAGFTGAAALTISNSASVTLTSNAAVSGTLTLSSGSLNLNTNTLTLNSAAAAQSITGSGSNAFNITNGTISLTGSGTHTITLSNFGTSSSGGLTLGTDVTLQMNSNAALNCGGNGTTTSMLTVLGTMIMNSGTASNIDGGKPPFYGNASTLEYRVSYNVFDEWKSGTAITTPGVPQNVTINGSGITVTTPASERNVKGNLLISVGNFTLNGTVGGDLKVAGNITNNATFTHNDRAVYLNGASAQTLNGTLNGTTTTNCFPYLFIDNTSGGIILNTPVNVTNTLTLTSGVVTTTSTNILHIRNTAAGAMAGGSSSSYISGPLRWSVSNGSGGDYKFHVGKSSSYLPLNVNNPTGTSPVITAEAFAANAGGTAGSGLASLSTSEYWSVVNTGTLTASTISLAKASIGSNNGIGYSTTLAGTYTNLGGSATNTLITSNTVTAASTVGSLATTTYFVLGVKVAAPTITSFTASSGYVGTTISITGTNLTGATAVSIGGVAAASFTVNSATSISATVAAGGATGTISVTTPGGTATSASSFTFNGYISTQAGDWNSTSTWLGGAVPAASSTVTIDHAVTVNASVTNAPSSVTINSGKSLALGASGALTVTTVTNGGTLSWSGAGTLTIANGGTLTNNSTFTRGTGTVSYAGAGTVNGTTAITFNNLTIAGTVTLTTLPTIDGTLRINGGNVSAAPIYTSNSTLFYNVSYDRFVEWSATGVGTIGTTAGYPNNVTINAGTFNVLNGDAGTARAMNGTLTVASGATFNTGALNAQVTVGGDISNSGTISLSTTNGILKCTNFTNNVGATCTLSTTGGGDLEVTGSIVDNGTFNSNTRAIFFTGSAVQDISGSGTFNIDYIVSNKSGGRIRLLSNLLCEGPNTGNAIDLSTTNDILDLNGYTLTLSKASTASGITGNGYIRGSATSNLTILGTGALGTLRFDPSTPGTTNVLNNLTINRTSTGSATIGNNLIIGGTLTLTNGALTVGASTTLTYSGTSITRTSGTIDASNASATLTFANTSALTLPSSLFTGNVNNLTMNGTGGITLGSATTVAGTLTLTTGNIITTSTNTLTLSNSATGAVSGGNSSSYVEGPLDRTLANATNYTYPVGGATNYRPVILQSVVATGNPVVRVTMAETGATTGDGASIEATLLSARNWRLQTISGTFTSATLNITETALVNGTHEIAKSNSTQAGTYVSVGTGQAVSSGAITSPSGQTAGYYAIGVAKTYGVTYDANGGTGSQSDATAYAYNATVTVKNAGTMTRTGYTFSGWNTASNGSGTSRAVASTFAITADVTLYAQWTVNSYTLSYNGNGNTSGTAPSSASVNYLASTTVSGNTGSLAKTGFTFAGWNTASDGSGDNYAGGSSFTMNNAANVTLYAQWSTGTFEVDYDANGATGGSVPASGNFTFGATVTVSGNTGTLVRTGYTFAGWNTAANGTGTSYSGGGTFSMPGNNLTLFAQWTVNSYTLTYSTNSATSGTAPTGGSVNYNALVTVAGNTGSLARTGYTFGGWNTAANGSGTTYEGGNTFNMPAANTTLYAKWDINSYTVTYDGNGQSSGTAPASANYNYNATVTVSANSGSLAKTGFLFGGWNTASDGSGTTYTAGSGTFSMGTANVTLYAKWNSASSENSADFRSNGAVSFSSAANWQYDAGGGSWTTATQAPGSGNNVTITDAATMDADFTINVGKTLLLSTGGSLIINPTRTLTVAGTANFGGRPVTLKSTSAGTAAIGQVSGTLSNATAVTVERYVTARRRWRALTAPLLGSGNVSIYDTWQNGGTPSGSTGAIMWRPGGGDGLWAGGAGTSILEYNSTGNAWSALTSTQSKYLFTASANNAYMVFVTGPYNTSGTYVTSGAATTTLSATGTLRSGTITYTNVAGLNKFYMFGNPYASAINLKEVGRTGFGNTAYIWNPGLASVGGWTSVNMNTGTLTGNTIQSGQAFFLYADNASNSLVIEEADKLTGSNTTYFRTEENKADGEMNIELNKYVDGKAELYDMTTVTYKGGNADRLPKLAQIYENLSVYQNGADFGVANRTLVNGEDNVQLRIWQMNEANYQLKINLSSMKLPAGTTAVLADAFLNKETSLSLTEDNLVDFNVTNNATSSGQRFRIVLRRSSDIPVTSSDAPRFHIYPNPVEKGSAMQLEFRNQDAGKYEVTVYSMTGVAVQKAVVRHGGGTFIQPIALDQRLSAGNYLVEVMSENGARKQIKLTVQ